MASMRQFVATVQADLFRYRGKASFVEFLSRMLMDACFTYSFWLRWCAHFGSKGKICLPLFLLGRLFYAHYQYKTGIQVSYSAEIGDGLYIGHGVGLVVSGKAVLGRNCTLSQGVTIGLANRGPRKGAAVIGDDVFIAAGAKIIGKVYIGNDVAIGANCVVTKDVEDHAVVVGIPGRVISHEGAIGYVNNTMPRASTK